MIIPLTTPMMPAVIAVFGSLPTEFAFGNCEAWLQLSSQPSPLAAKLVRGADPLDKPAGWLYYQKNKASSNELTAMLYDCLIQFNSTTVYVTVHWYVRMDSW